MKFLTDDEGLVINVALITAVRFKANNNDGSYKNKTEYPHVADVHVSGKEKPFTIYLTGPQKAELSLFIKSEESNE